uniref:Uncharacterized protein n=1 Tax=Meloidogyne incognita TaxID=6306 RepID=A0A914LRZ1_MELIC
MHSQQQQQNPPHSHSFTAALNSAAVSGVGLNNNNLLLPPLATTTTTIPSSLAIDSSFSSSGSESPSLSLQTGTADDSLSTIGNQRIMQMAAGTDTASTLGVNDGPINLQIFVPELQMQKCLSVPLDEFVWDIKQRLFESLPQQLNQYFNYGLFLPPCDGRAGKFLLDDRPLRDYPFHDCAPYVELKFKKRVYKMLRLDEKTLRSVHSKSNLRKFSEAVQNKNIQKLDRLCQQGLDPNFHDSHGETPLTLASGIPGSQQVIVQLVGGGAHLDFRNTEGQTGMHKAAFLSVAENVRVLLELGASPNYKDLIGLTPLYYNMLNAESNAEVTEMLLAEAADLDIACKNGLCKHTEQLIYYGANIDARNINGNTPLHVCAVNGRVECAQLLLYRGADPSLINGNNQTAVQVAQIVGNMAVANVILGHSPQSVVPFLEPPRLNTRRRLSTRQSQDGSIISMSRRRSLSHCSSSSTIASSHPHRYSSVNINQQLQEQQQINPINNQNPSMTSSTSEYGTLRRIPANSVQHQQPGFEPNTPRILVIPRGPKGFGFILRGARYADSMQLDFRPTLTIPALQFFEGVDMQGMAMRAGLRPGDFLLEINGVDVRAASHEQVVELIHQCGDTITLKVVTIDVDLLAREQQLQNTQHLQQQIYTSSSGINYATVGRRNHSVPRLNGSSTTENPANLPPPPPPPPQRDPSTTLSFGRRSFAASQFTAAVDVHNYSPNNSTLPCDVLPNSSVTFPQQQLTFVPIEQQTRCASVKLTKSVRRISAAELEHLMVQQGSSNSSDQQKQQIVEQQTSQNNNVGIPKRFTSVAEMKRRKQQSVRNSNNNDQNQLMKSSISTPDLQAAEGNENNIYSENKSKIILRPKTPPPPPPQSLWKNSINLRGTEDEGEQQLLLPPSQLPSQNSNTNTSAPIYASTVVVVPSLPQQNNKSGGGPPAPPPPPPANLLQKHSQPSTSSTAPTKPLQPKKQPETTNSAPASGISAETLRSVRLRPVKQTSPTKNENKNIQQNLKTSLNEGNEGGKIAPPIDFNSDLRSALARRRSKVRIVEETSESGGSGNEDNNLKNNKIVVNNIENNNGKGQQQQNVGNGGINNNNGGGGGGILTGRYNGGLSLRESVLENVSGAAAKCGHVGGKMTANTSSHSPPGGFIGTKKDSGYTSSRTSLEPSECGDCENNNGNGSTIVASSLVNTQHSLPVKHRVNVLSQQLIDQQTSTQSPLLTGNNKSFCPERDNNNIGSFLRIPAVDYDDQSENSSINSNNHLVDNQEQQPSSSSNQSTPKGEKDTIKEWTCLDVCEWLEYLELSEHCSSFCEIKGIDLLYFDRSKYTALGVTRIGHRQKMEKSIKDFKEK